MNHATAAERRSFLAQGALLSIGALLWQPADAALAAEHDGEGQSLEVPPTEDLMREHGVLDRVLLIYDEILGRRLLQGQEFPPEEEHLFVREPVRPAWGFTQAGR